MIVHTTAGFDKIIKHETIITASYPVNFQTTVSFSRFRKRVLLMTPVTLFESYIRLPAAIEQDVYGD